jgi:hypothetical protein
MKFFRINAVKAQATGLHKTPARIQPLVDFFAERHSYGSPREEIGSEWKFKGDAACFQLINRNLWISWRGEAYFLQWRITMRTIRVSSLERDHV